MFEQYQHRDEILALNKLKPWKKKTFMFHHNKFQSKLNWIIKPLFSSDHKILEVITVSKRGKEKNIHKFASGSNFYIEKN